MDELGGRAMHESHPTLPPPSAVRENPDPKRKTHLVLVQNPSLPLVVPSLVEPLLLDQLADVDMLEFDLGRRRARGEELGVGGFACAGGAGHEDDGKVAGMVCGHPWSSFGWLIWMSSDLLGGPGDGRAKKRETVESKV